MAIGYHEPDLENVAVSWICRADNVRAKLLS